MKPTRRVLYKICWDMRKWVYFGHRTCSSLRTAKRVAKKLAAVWKDVSVLRITKQRSKIVTNKVLGRPGPNPYFTKRPK